MHLFNSSLAGAVNRQATRFLISFALGVCTPLISSTAGAHGNVTPQQISTDGLPPLEGELTENPYRSDKVYQRAIEIGASAFSENCARCHGLGGVSGGIAPDLRKLPTGKEGDDYFQMRVRNGSIRNGITYMPPFKDIIREEAIWAIRSWLDSVYIQE